jgi:eukaryotic-like serine/threonine-protein kinase
MENKAQDDDLVMNLVELALNQPEQERRAYLQKACAGESELFDQAWEYVQWESRMQGFLLEPLYSPPVNEHPFEPGELLDGRFRILREIAQGGMGVVYEAMDERLERRIAIKCAKTGFRKRLPPEVRHAREITHPNVCKIFEIHTARTPAGEIDFVTMEYLEGETLADRLKRGPLPEVEARVIARQLCSGLAEAHGKGVIHGDLKSNNVILTKVTDAPTRSVITDFGMSRATQVAQTTAQSGPRGGTPDYMAPELLKGEKASVASDIYALGVMLHELASGRKPAAGAAISVHPKWNGIVAKCLAADPENRYPTATQIVQAFEPPRSRRWFMMAAAAVLVATITGVLTYQGATAPKEGVRLAMLPFTYGADLAPVADGVFRDASANLAKIRGGAKARYSAVPLAEIQRAKVETPEKARAVFGATHILHGTLTKEQDRIVLRALLTDTRTGVNTKEWKTDYAPGQVRYIPVALAGFATGALHLPTPALPAMNAAAERDYSAGLAAARKDSGIDQALTLLGRAVTDDPDSPQVHAALGEAQWYKYWLTRDREWLDRSQESARQAELRNLDLGPVHRLAGLLKLESGFYELATADFLRAIELEPAESVNYIRLGQVYQRNNQFDEALAALQKAVTLEPKFHKTHQELGNFYFNRGRYKEALPHFQKMVELDPNEPIGHFVLGEDYMNMGRFTEAESELRLSAQQGETPVGLHTLGVDLMYQGRDQEAINYINKALSRYPQRHLWWMTLGIAYRRTNQPAESERANRRGLDLAESEAAHDARNAVVLARLAYFCARLGDRRRAESEVARALQIAPNNAETRFAAALTYEALSQRKRTLEVLYFAPTEVLTDLSRWPDVADLSKDASFQQLLVSQHLP